MKKLSLLAALAALSACGPAPTAEEAGEAVATEASAVKGQRSRVLVGFRETPGASHRQLVQSYGASIRKEFPEVSAFAVEMDQARMGDLARNGAVAYVEEDVVHKPLGLSSAQLSPALGNGLYGLLTTRASDVHARGVTGAGIRIGVADTGLDYTHPDIAPVYAGGIDTVSNDNDPWWNGDVEETHGTHVAGTIVGANDSQGMYGVAYGAQLFHARVLGPNGGYSSDIMDGVRWLVESAGCKVVNMSLGGGMKSRTEESFYKSMRSKGALIVAATGNDGASKISYPAAYASNISVGAVDRTNTIADFSNKGRGIDVVAPGVSVLSSVPAGTGTESSVAAAGSEYASFGMEFAGSTSGVTGTLVDCGLGQAGECPASVAGNIALIQRGTISFADKVSNAMAQGATAAILYNNTAGDFTGTMGAAGDWIPAVSVSDTTGAALLAQVGSSATVVNQASAWDHYDGTSMATPHVTGVVALIWAANPSLSNTTVESYLFTTAKDLGAGGYDTTYGNGIVDASAAVARAGR